VKRILARGDRAIATSRGDTARLAELKDAGAAVLSLDVAASQAEINAKVEEAIAIYGGIDVVVNSAGYIQAGIAEETTYERPFVSTMLACLLTRKHHTETQSSLPSSMSISLALSMSLARSCPISDPRSRALLSLQGLWVVLQGRLAARHTAQANLRLRVGYRNMYFISFSDSGTGVAESMKLETESWGIRTHLFQIGHFRTKLLNTNNFKAAPRTVDAYKEMNDMIFGFLGQADQNQPGDPEKAVNIMIDIVKEEGVAKGKTPPLRLPIGKDALATLRNKYVKYLELCNEWEDAITSTDFDVPDVKASTTVQGHDATVL
jgi:hypothetical protein